MLLEKDTSIGDRFALGLLNGLIGLPTGFFLWFILNGFLLLDGVWLPIQAVLWFAFIMALLGMLIHDAFLAAVYGKLWSMIMNWLRYF